MEQPKLSAASPQRQSTFVNGNNQASNKKRRPPSPEEVLAFYESQGFDTRSASLKAIEDLQSLLLRGGSSYRRNSLSAAGDLNRKLDNVNTRLAILEMKLDSKPGFPESLAIALASGSLLHAFASSLPPAIRAVAGAWRSVSSATTARPPSS